MKIAICSLSQFTYVAEFIDAAQGLSKKHEVCYFLGFYCQNSIKLLQQRNIPYQLLLDRQIDIKSKLVDPAIVNSPYEIFQKYFFKYAELVLPKLLKTIKVWKPNLIASHYRDYAGMTTAEILEIPMVSFGTAGSPFRVKGLDPPYGVGVSRDISDRAMQIFWELNLKFNQKVDLLYNKIIRQPYGLSNISEVSTLHSKQLVLLSMISSLNHKSSPDPPYIKFVGPLFLSHSRYTETNETDIITAIAASPKPRIFISLGTIHVESTKKCLKALENFSGTLIVSLGGKESLNYKDFVRHKNVICKPFFHNFHKVLELIDAIVTTASGKTVLEALSAGKPLVCIPRQGEQYENALQIQNLGAGELVFPCPKKWNSQNFFTITEQVATEKRYKKSACVLQSEIAISGGVKQVLKLIETM